MYVTGRMKWYTKEDVISMTKQLGMMHILYFALKKLYCNPQVSRYCIRNNKSLIDVIISPMMYNYNEFIKVMDFWEGEYKKHLKEKEKIVETIGRIGN